MTPLRITKDHSAFSFTAAAAPVAEVDSGALVVLETSDEAYEKLSRGVPYQELHSQMNAVTGPLAVRGAEPGDALRVTLIEIGILRAWAAWIPGFGILGRRTETQQVAEVPLADGHLCIGRQLRVPLDPMVGCIGVAPRRGVGSAIGQCGPWGGNMDLREFRPGTSLCLPVFHPGALLSLGDVHAAMGAGEPCFVAIEASAEVTVRIDLEKGRRLEHPRLDLPEGTAFLGMGQSLWAAQKSACEQAFEHLISECGLQPFEAFAFASACMEWRLGGPAWPMALAYVPRPGATSSGDGFGRSGSLSDAVTPRLPGLCTVRASRAGGPPTVSPESCPFPRSSGHRQ